jgi:hypothetical protein
MGEAMIRQAISCDICGAEKKQTNHWFVAYSHAGELRVSGWSAQRRLRAGSKHLCGQTCLYKLVDEFIAGSLTARAQAPVAEPVAADEHRAVTDASLISKAAYACAAVPSKALSDSVVASWVTSAAPAAVIAIAPSRPADERAPIPTPPDYASRHWRAEAWERERERCSGVGAHRKNL